MARTVIVGGSVVDGSGADARDATVIIQGDRILEVVDGHKEPRGADTVIDATGRTVAPGFIDPHQHSDCSPLVTPGMDSFLRQGVTTAIVGNCGLSGWPGSVGEEALVMTGVRGADANVTWGDAASFFATLDAANPAINVASLLGHGSIRQAVIGLDARQPTADELDEMCGLVRDAMRAGALGMSTGLIYVPGAHARTEELIALASELRPFGGVYASHMRNEGVGIFDAIEEAVRIGREAGVAVHLSHLKLDVPSMWGRTGELFAAIDAARASGVDVTMDQYPYAAWETSLEAFLPPWAPVADLPAIVESDRDRLRTAVLEGDGAWQSSVKDVGWDLVAIGDHVDRSLSGRSIGQIAIDRGDADPFVTFCDLLLADPKAGVVGHSMSPQDVDDIRRRSDVMVGSDGIATSPDGPLGDVRVHPRYYGTYPRVLGRAVRDLGLLRLEDAVRSMTALVADRFGLADRGRLQAGAAADIVIFDPETVADTATFEDPHRFPIGYDWVIVNGVTAWAQGEAGERAGRVVRFSPAGAARDRSPGSVASSPSDRP